MHGESRGLDASPFRNSDPNYSSRRIRSCAPVKGPTILDNRRAILSGEFGPVASGGVGGGGGGGGWWWWRSEGFLSDSGLDARQGLCVARKWGSDRCGGICARRSPSTNLPPPGVTSHNPHRTSPPPRPLRCHDYPYKSILRRSRAARPGRLVCTQYTSRAIATRILYCAYVQQT